MTDAWKKPIGLADIHGTVVTVTYEPPDADDDQPWVAFRVDSGAATIIASPTPEAMRQLAAALLDAAEHTEQAAA